MTEWYDPVSAFARKNGYRFVGDLAFCTIKAKFGQTFVELWVSNVGGGGHRASLGGVLAEYDVIHCRANVKVVGEVKVEVRRRTLFDRLISRGVRIENEGFDSKYVALGKEEDVRRFLRPDVVKRFVAMWSKTEGLELEDGEVTLSGGQFRLNEEDLGFILETVGAIAANGTGGEV